MPKAIWSGSISFEMVTIPVKLYGAEAAKKAKPKPPARARSRAARAPRRTRKVG